MSDPRHPVKIVILLRDEAIRVFADKPVSARIFVADYYLDDVHGDVGDAAKFGKDRRGVYRFLEEEVVVVDTAMVRNIINKTGE